MEVAVKKLAMITLFVAFCLSFSLPLVQACGGMTILPPPPASDPDVPSLPSDSTNLDSTDGTFDNVDDRDGDGDVDADDIFHYDDGTFTEAIL